MKKGGGDPGASTTIMIITNSNKRKIHDEISSEEEGLPVAKHACLDTNNKNHSQIQDSVMSLSNDSKHGHHVSSSFSSVNWSGSGTTKQDSAYYRSDQQPPLDYGDMMMMSIPEYYETNHQPQNHHGGDHEDGDFMFFSNAAAEEEEAFSTTNFVLSSGRWNIVNNQDTEQKTEKLTIDKEFEQYFSMLML